MDLSRLVKSTLVVLACDVAHVCVKKKAGLPILLSDTFRWFFVHGVANVIIGVLCIPGMLQFLAQPNQAFDSDGRQDEIWSPTSKWPLTLTVILHVYHMVAGFKLTSEDWFHHTVFVPTLALPGMIFDWGCFCNWFAFFICGIPGAMDYLLLAAHKMNACGSFHQKRVSANLNIWVRVPGILFGVGIGYLLFTKGSHRVPHWSILCQLILMPINALYYAKQSIINYTLHTVKSYVPDDKSWSELKQLQNRI